MLFMPSELTQGFIKKISEIRVAPVRRRNDEVHFDVNQIIVKATNFYEKIRYFVDYKEEHTIHRSAVERILKRKINIEQKTAVGLSLVKELVSGQYVPQSSMTEEVVSAVDKTVAKFLRLRELAGSSATNKRLLSLAASEVDRYLDMYNYRLDETVVGLFYDRVRRSIEVDKFLSESVLDLQISAACHRNLLGFDDEMLSYTVWKILVPNWESASDEDVQSIAKRLPSILKEVEAVVKSPVQWQIARRLKNETVYFSIIRELVHQYGAESGQILLNQGLLDAYVKSFLEKKYEKENTRIKKSGIRAVIYLFFTKVILALLIELPYERLFLTTVNYVPLAVNILFPPVLLFVFTRQIKTLGKANTDAIIAGIHDVISEEHFRKIKVSITTLYSTLNLIFTFIYLLFIVAIFGGIISVLRSADFNIVSITFFLLFLTLVSYFIFRIRFNAKQWNVVKDEKALATLGGIIVLPIVNAGQWMSQSFSSVNMVVFLLDFVIETPFKFILHFSNAFITYMKERVEEIR